MSSSAIYAFKTTPRNLYSFGKTIASIVTRWNKYQSTPFRAYERILSHRLLGILISHIRRRDYKLEYIDRRFRAQKFKVRERERFRVAAKLLSAHACGYTVSWIMQTSFTTRLYTYIYTTTRALYIRAYLIFRLSRVWHGRLKRREIS